MNRYQPRPETMPPARRYTEKYSRVQTWQVVDTAVGPSDPAKVMIRGLPEASARAIAEKWSAGETTLETKGAKL